MSKQFSISILLLLLPFFLWADHYPINKNIDVLHYSFELILSDSTNEIKGKTQVKVRFDKEGIAHFRLDLANATAQRQDKGMKVDAIYVGNSALQFKHLNDELFIQLAKPASIGDELVFTIQYHGVPFDGLRIGPTKFGDRSFFNENWPIEPGIGCPPLIILTTKLLLNLLLPHLLNIKWCLMVCCWKSLI